MCVCQGQIRVAIHCVLNALGEGDEFPQIVEVRGVMDFLEFAAFCWGLKGGCIQRGRKKALFAMLFDGIKTTMLSPHQPIPSIATYSSIVIPPDPFFGDILDSFFLVELSYLILKEARSAFSPAPYSLLQCPSTT